MLLKEKTKEEYGYDPDSLAKKSGKRVAVRCDYCNSVYNTTPKKRVIGHEHVQKDACIKCKFKKRADVSMARDGVKNSAQRKDVRVKMSDVDWDSLKDKILSLYDEGYSLHYVCEKLSLPQTSLVRRMNEWNIEMDGKSRRSKTMVERYGEDYKEQSGRTHVRKQ